MEWLDFEVFENPALTLANAAKVEVYEMDWLLFSIGNGL